MKTNIVTLGVVSCLALWLTGCADAPARRIDQHDPQVTSITKIDMRDYVEAVEKLTQSLLASGALDTAPNRPALIGVDLVVNNTGDRMANTKLITDRVKEALTVAGKARAMLIGKAAEIENPLANDLKKLEAFEKDSTTIRKPDFTLSGAIDQVYSAAGNVKQSTFVFKMSLLDARHDEVWIKSVDIGKQGTRPGLGL